MRNRLLPAAGLFAAATLAPSHALSQTATSQFNVQITIEAECLINSASDMDFGTVGVIDTAVQATSTIAVQCTGGTPYDIGLSQGLGDGATTATRFMTGPEGGSVAYSLYMDPGNSDVWGDTIGTDTASGTGSGSEQAYTVYGQVPVQSTPGPGTYTDTVTVTVTY